MTSAVPLNAANSFSIWWCKSMVPVSMRTPPVPVPYLRMASMARFVDARISDQAEIVVGREHEHLAAFGLHARPGAALSAIWNG